MADLPAGATFGSLVHGVLEHADPRPPTWRAELRGHVVEQLALVVGRRRPRRPRPRRSCRCSTTSLGPLAGRPHAWSTSACATGCASSTSRSRWPAATYGRRRRRPAGRDRPASCAGTSPRTTRCWRTPTGSRRPSLGGQSLRGYLSGSIDVVLRVGRRGRPAVPGRRLQDQPARRRSRPLTALDYTPGADDRGDAALALPAAGAALLRGPAPLPAVAASPGYDPERHLGGILYLYVRGMCGPETPEVDGIPCGVFAWQPPAAMVVELSDLLDGRLARSTGRRRDGRPTRSHGPTPTTVGVRSVRRCCCATFNEAGVLDAADVHVAVRLGGAAPTRPTSRCGWPARARSPCALSGSGRSASTWRTIADLPVEDEATAAVARARPPGSERVGGQPAGARGDAAARRRPALPRPLLARGASGLRRPASRGWRRTPPEVDAPLLEAGLERIFPGAGYDEQRAAARAAASRWTTVLTGGPGTGKTTTVAGLLALVAEQHEHATGRPSAHRARCADRQGGRAAAGGRRSESIDAAIGAPRTRPTSSAGRTARLTLHRLLGWRPDSQRPVPARPHQPAAATTSWWSTRPRWSRSR